MLIMVPDINFNLFFFGGGGVNDKIYFYLLLLWGVIIK